jgi:hypothetical protein
MDRPVIQILVGARVNEFSVESSTAIVFDALCGSIPMITISSIGRSLSRCC